MDRGLWQATVHSVAQSRTQLKQVSSSSSPYSGHRIHVLVSFCGGGSLLTIWESLKWILANQSDKLLLRPVLRSVCVCVCAHTCMRTEALGHLLSAVLLRAQPGPGVV